MSEIPLPAIRRERSGDATRAALFRAALEEFRAVGFDRASVARIARAAGVSRPSFYFHFPTREHVLLELQWSLERRVVERLARCRSLREVLGEFVDTQIEAEASVGDSGLYRDMLSIYARRPEGLPIDEQPFPTVRELERHFARAAERGELRDGLEPAEGALLFLSSVFGLLIGSPGPPEARRGALETLVSLFVAEDAP